MTSKTVRPHELNQQLLPSAILLELPWSDHPTRFIPDLVDPLYFPATTTAIKVKNMTASPPSRKVVKPPLYDYFAGVVAAHRPPGDDGRQHPGLSAPSPTFAGIIWSSGG